MAKQRNNVAKLPFEARKRVCEMLFDSFTYDAIRDAVQGEHYGVGALHNTSLLAYSHGAEYREYCDSRKNWEDKTGPDRWASALINDGKGAESAADLAEMFLLSDLKRLAGAGCADVDSAAKLANALGSVRRVNKGKVENDLAEQKALNKKLREEVEALKKALAEGSARMADPVKVAEQLNQIFGVKKTGGAR
jgi:hypothetical protein